VKRSITDVLRRSLISTVANWPVIVARVIETILAFGIMVAALFAIIVPMVVSAGLTNWSIPEAKNPWEAVVAILAEHAGLFTYVFVTILIVVGLALAIHSFVMAGSTRIMVDAELRAPDTPDARREQFAVFTVERWMDGARAAWARVFWIYNGTWGVCGLIFLIPLIVIVILTILAAMTSNAGVVVGMTCLSIALMILLGVPLALVCAVWTQKAIVVCVARDIGAREALRSGWRESKADFLRHFVVLLLILLVSFGVASVLSAFTPFTLGFGSRDANLWTLFTGPAYLVLNCAQSAVTSGIGCWLIAAFAAMTEERR
jgi:hypothetical protein